MLEDTERCHFENRHEEVNFFSHSAQKSLRDLQPQSTKDTHQGFKTGPGTDATSEDTWDY